MNNNQSNYYRPKDKKFGYMFLLTAIFSLVSSLFAWGQGWLFSVNELNLFLMPMADLIVTTPLSLIAASGILNGRKWRFKLGLIASGVYIFGSVLVFITLVWQGSPYSIKLVFHSVFGFLFSTWFITSTLFRK
jgi:hypothetical protein